MYRISQFSKISGLTVKALRYYDQENILQPTFRNEDNQYRYYNEEDLKKSQLDVYKRQMETHLELLSQYQKSYEDKIKIYKGFEAEGLSVYFDYYQKLLYEHKVDYLILGHHFHKHCISNDYFGKEKMTKKDIYLYCNDVEKALETNLFSYLAHPDRCV